MDLIISERNRIKNKIKQIEGHLRLNENAEKRLRKSTCNVDFNRTKIQKMKVQNEEFKEEISKLTDRLDALGRGKLTDELRKQREKATLVAREKTIQKRLKKMEGMEEKQEQSVSSKQFYVKNRKSDREIKYHDKNCSRQYSYMLRVCKSLPTYIRNNLDNMPNNKGYIWRGIHFFGKKKEDSDTVILFESNRGGSLKIHKWENNYLKYTLIYKPDKKSAGKIEFIEEYKKCEFSKKRILITRRKPHPNEIHSGGGRSRESRGGKGGRGRGRGRGRGGRGRGRGRGRGGRGRGGRGRGRGEIVKLTPAEARKRSRGKINKVFQERKRRRAPEKKINQKHRTNHRKRDALLRQPSKTVKNN